MKHQNEPLTTVKGSINSKVSKREGRDHMHRWTNMQKIEVEAIVVFENLLASAMVFQKINLCCLQRLR